MLFLMRHTSLSHMPCPVARTLDVVGEWWTLLIIRDAFLGARRFEDFKATGIADNILSARLKKLVDEGIFERRPYQERPDRFEYLPTEKGRDLLPVLAALRRWGQVWTEGRDGSQLTHGACGHEVSVSLHCEECGRPLTSDEIKAARIATRPARAPLLA
jgi:DNA-binding HxlR family transcriptional regulator